MDGASGADTTASSSTSHIRLILRLRWSLMGRSLRATIASGWMPMDRSAATECCVGLVFSSPLGPMYGSSETCRKKHRSLPISCLIWRIASRKGRLSMSPTVPPTSVMTTSTSGPPMFRMRALISFVMCGMTCTVSPR